MCQVRPYCHWSMPWGQENYFFHFSEYEIEARLLQNGIGGGKNKLVHLGPLGMRSAAARPTVILPLGGLRLPSILSLG